MKIDKVDLEIQREPFARPFGFKGASFREKWNLVIRLEAAGYRAWGVGGLAVLWSDARVFAAHTEMGGNALMTAVVERGLQLALHCPFENPPQLLEQIYPQVHAYAKTITGIADLHPTFTLNSLVALDLAVWTLWARVEGRNSFDELLGDTWRSSLDNRQECLLVAPAVGYGMGLDEIKKMLQDGVALLKIKLGQGGDEAQMLASDQARLTAVHRLAAEYRTTLTKKGKVLYYLDFNGRYPKVETLLRLLEGADASGALERIAVIEEPFVEAESTRVDQLPLLVAADESVHGVEAVEQRYHQGYGAIAIKPAGKTLSVSLAMARRARQLGMVAFVADNACVPVLLEWNKNVAARLPAFPGVKGGIMESNGAENYGAWQALLEAHPAAGAPWQSPLRGAWRLDETYYTSSGGILRDPTPYTRLCPGEENVE